MKKLLLTTALLTGLSASVFAQGSIFIDNSANTTAGTTATSGGLVYVKTGNAAALEQADVSFALFAGTSSTSLTAITVGTGTVEAGDGDGNGLFGDNRQTSYSLGAAGIAANAVAWIELELWQGTTLPTYAAAVAAGDPAGIALFQSPTSSYGTTAFPQYLSAMPAVVLTTPEPSTMVLGGLGAAALLLFRRRK